MNSQILCNNNSKLSDEKRKLEDMKILEQLLKNKITMDSIDIDTKRRLICLCNEQAIKVKQRIQKIDNKIESLKKSKNN